MPGVPFYINMHIHCFTLDHVPEKFFDSLIGGKRFLRISKLRKTTLNRLFVNLVTRKWFIWIVRRFSRNGANQLRRLRGLIKYSSAPDQENLLTRLLSFYDNWNPEHSGVKPFRYVPLTMDMEYMNAGIPARLFDQQLKELHTVKSKEEWKEVIFPFVFADPRRQNLLATVKKAIESRKAPFSGIKIYPALGYYPFDQVMKDVYLYALQNNLPIVTHCVNGSVYFSGEPPKNSVHPLTTKACYGNNPDEYQLNWTHPLNYECLLNPVHLKQLWGSSAPDLSQLKICLGHFGGENEWLEDKNLLKFWEKSKPVEEEPFTNYLDLDQDWFGEKRNKWFLIIMELLRKYPNVYADISFTLHDARIYEVLKKILLFEHVRNKILFGTDYYVVSSVADENEVLNTLKKELNDAALFDLIVYENPKRFLNW